MQTLVHDLNRIYEEDNSLWEADGEPAGFQWIDADNAPENIVSFIRRSPATGRELICVCNFSPVPGEASARAAQGGEIQVDCKHRRGGLRW